MGGSGAKRVWPRRMLWIAAALFVALQAHSYYYLRFMVMYPFSPTYEPSIPADPVASKRVDVLNGLLTPMFESLNVARMHWAALSQKPPRMAGLTLLKGRELQESIFGLRLDGKSYPGYQSHSQYRKDQSFESYLATGYASMDYGIYAFFDNRVCIFIVDHSGCISIYKNSKCDRFYYSIGGNAFVALDNHRLGDKR